MKLKKKNNKISAKVNKTKKYAIIDKNGKIVDFYRLKMTAISDLNKLNASKSREQRIRIKYPFKIINISQMNN